MYTGGGGGGMLTGVVQWTEGMALRAETGSGFSLKFDAAPDHGGTEQGPRPKEITLLSLGGCTAMDVLSILRKMQVPFTDFGISLEADSASQHPAVFTTVRLTYHTKGEGVERAKVDRAITLSLQRYCGVANMINKTAQLVVLSEINGQEMPVEV